MENIIYITGLPGSGKTTYAKQFFSDYYLVDDMNRKKVDLVEHLIKTNVKTVITDVHTTNPTYLYYVRWFLTTQLMVREDKIRWIFFENNLQKCIENVKMRNDGRIISFEAMKEMSKLYIIKNHYEVIKVYDSKAV